MASAPVRFLRACRYWLVGNLSVREEGAMAISERTAKILWGRAGAVCSLPDCHQPLVVDGPGRDPDAVIGEMAHIVAQSPDGPRGQYPVQGGDRDGVENLILLCTKHHSIIDQQPAKYDPLVLYELKQRHERWVREQLSPQQRFTGVHVPSEVTTDRVHSTMLPVSRLPLTVFGAPCTLDEDEIRERIVYPPELSIMAPFILSGRNLWTFCDLTAPNNPFSACVGSDRVKRISARDWWDHPDKSKLYMWLLDRVLNKVTGRRQLNFDKLHRRYYFEPLNEGGIRVVRYHNMQGSMESRQVAWRPVTKATGEPKKYWEHLAVSLRFHRVADSSWCLSIRPERRYTTDGFTPHEGRETGRKSTSRASRLYNHEVLREINFWRDYLSDGSPRIMCQFGTQTLIIDTELLAGDVSWPGVPEDSKPFRHTRYEEDLWSFAEYQAALSSEFGEGDEWEEEAEEWDLENEE